VADELGRMLGEAARRGELHEADATVDAIAARVVGASRRRRRVRAVTTMAASFAAVAVLAVGSLAVSQWWGGDSEPAGHALDVSASQRPTPAPSEAVAVPSPSAGDAYPQAYELTPDVLDQAGEGWTVDSFSMALDPYGDSNPDLTPAVVYLENPKGVRYLAATLPLEWSHDLRVVAWHEEQREVIVWRAITPADATGSANSAALNLETGTLTPLRLTMPGGVPTDTLEPLAVDTDGDELWEAHGTADDGSAVSRFYRWSLLEGWTVAALSRDVQLGPDEALASPRLTPLVRADGGAVVLELTEEVSGPDGDYWQSAGRFVVYDLGRDEVTSNPLGDGCVVGDWIDAETLGVQCDTGANDVEPSEVLLDAASPLGAPIGPAPTPGELDTVGQRGVVGWKTSTNIAVTYRDCAC